VRRAYLGIGGAGRPLPPNARVDGQSSGVEATSVVTDSPAGRAGLRPGDVVLSVDGERVESVGALQGLMTGARIGRTVAVTVWREGRVVDLAVALTELAD